MAPTFFGAKNNVETKVSTCQPWEFIPNVPAHIGKDKKKYLQWRSHPETKHLVFTATEGINSGLRCSKHNPVKRLHGLIVDFDSLANDSFCDELLNRVPELYRPTWMSRTFSGGVRLVYLFEEPLAMEQDVLAEQFLKIAASELQIKKLFPNPDDGAFADLTKLYDVGVSWKKLGDYRLSSNALHHWLTEAAKKTKWSKLSEIKIPIEAVAEEVDRQFPNRWDGSFEVGARGVAFFDPNSTNPTSSIVTEAGMICFNQDQLFHSWAKIFGASFVKQFQQDQMGAAVKDVWFDGKFYYRKTSYGVWESSGREDFALYLRSKFGMEPKRLNTPSSQLDDTMLYTQEHRRVSGILPVIYNPEELVWFNGKRYLNCSSVQAMAPVDIKQEWGENFPFLANFFDTCLDDMLVPCVEANKPAMPPRVILFAWMKRFYGSALAGDLRKGQALFLAGLKNSGKTWFSNFILGGLLGGGMDASDFLNSSTNFNKALLEVGLWHIDDGTASHDVKAHQRFSEMIKRSVANPIFSYHPKFKDAQRIEWHGRVVVTLNDDSSAVQIIPNLDSAVEDKIIVLKLAEQRVKFPDWDEMREILARELPFFARWLIDYEPPPEVISDEKRFGINSYIHEDLRVKALHAGGVSDLLELIELWIRRMNPIERYGKHWQGTASDWWAELHGDDALKALVSKFTVRGLGRKFVEASRLRDSRVSVVERSTKSKAASEYRIFLSGHENQRETKKIVVSFEEATESA